MFRALARLAITFAVTRMLSRAGRSGGIVDSVLRSGRAPRRRRR